jgi:hypothetical protein
MRTRGARIGNCNDGETQNPTNHFEVGSGETLFQARNSAEWPGLGTISALFYRSLPLEVNMFSSRGLCRYGQ